MTGSMLAAIGRTPVVKLQRVVPAGSADVWVKLEFYNPTASPRTTGRSSGSLRPPR